LSATQLAATLPTANTQWDETVADVMFAVTA